MMPSKIEFKTSDGRDIELSADDCLANDVIFSGEFNPHRVRPWIIGNEYGALALVWASHEQDAFDAACDADKLAGLAIDADDYAEQCKEACEKAGCVDDNHTCDVDGVMLLGNASEPFDSNNAWIVEVALTPLQERYFAEARGANVDTLGEL